MDGLLQCARPVALRIDCGQFRLLERREILSGLVGSEMCIRDRIKSQSNSKIKRSQPRFTRQLLQAEGGTHASHHSTGRALARLQLLILMHRALERPSGGSAQWATRHGCRVSRPRPWMADGGGPTEQDRSEGMPSHSEAPNDRGKSPWLLGAFPSDPP